MASLAEDKLPIVFGTMSFGTVGSVGVRITSTTEASKMLDIFQAHGYSEVDTARLYGGGASEEFLARVDWQGRNLTMGTKLYPNAGMNATVGPNVYTHKPEDIRRGFMDSLEALKTNKVDLWYLHGPDRNTPFEDTLRTVNELHQEGRFTRFGISNYMSWEVAQMCEVCERNGWIKPTVYQGIYNALHRAIEPELIPCLRHYGIALYCFQPLAGGFLTSRYRRNMKAGDFEPGSRFDPNDWLGKLTQGRYWNDAYFDALEIIRHAADKHGLTEAECAFRWLCHHSQMSKGYGDKVIVGASSAEQLKDNLSDLKKGPLPGDIVEALEASWLKVKGVVPKYFH